MKTGEPLGVTMEIGPWRVQTVMGSTGNRCETEEMQKNGTGKNLNRKSERQRYKMKMKVTN